MIKKKTKVKLNNPMSNDEFFILTDTAGILICVYYSYINVISLGSYAPKPSSGPHKTRECLPLIVFIRNRLKYALNGREVTSILAQRLVKVDGKVRTDATFPAGFMGKY